jgi:hypothetical protein
MFMSLSVKADAIDFGVPKNPNQIAISKSAENLLT